MVSVCVMPTSEEDIVDQHHGHFRVQILHHVFDLVLSFAGNASVDLSCSFFRFAKIDIECLTRVELLDTVQELFQRTETRAHCSKVSNIQLLILLAVPKHVEEMLVGFVNLRLVEGAVTQSGKQLALGVTAGACGQHGQGGGDAQW